MQRVETEAVLERALRARVCTMCQFRPEGSENLPPTAARSCQPLCPIFANVPALAAISKKMSRDPAYSFERAIEDGICLKCTVSLSAGDYCAERFSRSCPLSCYAGTVLETIESVLDAKGNQALTARP